MHQLDPAECESEKRRRGLCQADRVIEPALPIETLKQLKQRMYLDLKRLGVKYLALRQSTKQPDRLLGSGCNP